MRAYTTFGPPLTGIERLALDYPRSLRLEQPIQRGENFEGIFVVSEWGIRGLRFSGKGQIGFVSDGTGKLDELARNYKINVEFLRSQKNNRPPSRNALLPPKADAKPGSPLECWHTQLDPKGHTGVNIWGPNNDRFVIDLEW